MPTVYDIVAEKIIEKLDQGVVPWRMTWACGAPQNFVSKKAYRGINSMLLGMAEYASPYWVTMKQCNDLGGKVKKGEKSWIVTFASKVEDKTKKADGEKKKDFFMLRYYRVFNLMQCEGIEVPEVEKRTVDTLQQCEELVGKYANKPEVITGGGRACYSPTEDKVHMPPRDTFDNSEYYYSVLFHELGHSTGHASRLNRDTVTQSAPFGSPVYSHEELVAEFCSAFLCGVAGIAPAILDNAAAYIDNWRKAIQGDKKLLTSAAGKGQKAADYIQGITFQK